MSRQLKAMLVLAATLGLVVAFLAFVSHSAVAATPDAPVAQPPTGLAPDAVVTVTVLHTNDFHGQLEVASCTTDPCDKGSPGIARVATVISDVRSSVGASNFVLLDAGDEMQGSLLSNLKKGEPTIDLFNLLGYQAATFGNHEFDWGQPTLISRTQQALYPFVSANVVVSDTGDCATAGWTSPSFTTPWITMTVGAPGNQAVLGIVGVTTQETPYITIASATAGLCFKDPYDSIVHYYDAIKAAGADTIIVLSHLGYYDGGYGYGFSVYGDQTLAKKLLDASKPADLIIGGHSHTNLSAATIITSSAMPGKSTYVVQAFTAGRRVGRADLTIDTTAHTTLISWQPITVSASTPADPAAAARLATWTDDPAYQAQINQVIGYSNVDLVRDYNGDNMMGNLVDDAIYNDLNNDGNPANDVDMFFNNAGGIRTDLTSAVKPFTLTYGMMFSVLPFGNATIVGNMTGAQIQDLLNQSATLFKGAIQPAGIRYTFYSYTDTLPGPQPYAWGAYNIIVYNRSNGLWEPLVMTKTYKVGTNEFLAPAGQDGYVQFKYFTNGTYWGDMLNSVNHWISITYGTPATAYNGPNGDALLDGRIFRNGTAAYNPNDPTQVVPVTILHHNDSHGDLLDYPYRSVMQPGYTRLATLIKQERLHNPSRTLLLDGGDNIQGDAMMAFYKAAFTGKGADGTTLPVTLTVNPMIAAMNSMNYDAMTLGNHEFNFGHYIFTGTLGQANFPLLQANLYDNGQYGIAQVNVRPYITKILPGPVGNIKLAVLGIGNHRVPQYELPSNIPGLAFTNPITEAQARAPALKATNDAVIALTHIGFTTDPKSVEVDTNVDTNLAAQTTGIDAIIGAHSHTNPSIGQDPYKFLPTIVGAPDNTPVIINQAQSYNYFLGEVVLGLLPKAGGGYQVVSRAGRDLQNCIGLNSPSKLCSAATPEDAATRVIVKPYDDFLTAYKTRIVGQTTVPIDASTAYTRETNAANLQADASIWKLNQELSATLHVDFHLSGAMTNGTIATTATVTTPYTMIINDMFTLMPYENSLVVFRLNGPQLKTILERAYRNYFYYKYVPGRGGYSYYTTCMIDTNSGAQIKYRDTYPYYPSGNNVAALIVNGQPVNFLDATKFYTVSTVNYLAAGSCNFNNGGVTIWPLNQIVADTQYYVRDVVIEYLPTLAQPIAPAVEGRLQFLTFNKAVFLPIVMK